MVHQHTNVSTGRYRCLRGAASIGPVGGPVPPLLKDVRARRLPTAADGQDLCNPLQGQADGLGLANELREVGGPLSVQLVPARRALWDVRRADPLTVADGEGIHPTLSG